MKALLKAIVTMVHDHMDLQALAPGGLHHGEAPTGTAMPYLIYYTLASGPPERDTSDEQVEAVPVMFNVFSVSDVVSAQLVELLERLFMGRNPDLSRKLPELEEGRCIDAIKSNEELSLDPDRTEQGKQVWIGRVSFEFMVQRDPTVKES